MVAPYFESLSGLAVTKVGEVGTIAGHLGLAFPSLITALEPQGTSSGLSLLLRRGDEAALGYGDFLRIGGVQGVPIERSMKNSRERDLPGKIKLSFIFW